MMLACVQCAVAFEPYPVIDGAKLNLHGRKRCLDCLPLRRLNRPRKPVLRPRRTKTCESCGGEFPTKVVFAGKVHFLWRRRFCLECSPFGAHNTSPSPKGLNAHDLAEQRRRRRNAKTYRSLKKRRSRRKSELVAAAGGRCTDCGYDRCLAALEFHHRDPTTKNFALGEFSGSIERLRQEAEKCDLLCASFHRLRHAAREDPLGSDPVVAHRRRRKI